jgi:hypothetical protein
MGDARRIATLTAFAAIGEQRAQDQTLDHLDVILSEIDDRAAARERERRLEIAGLIDQAGVRLADACALVLDESINDADLRDAILTRVGRGRLEEAIGQLREHTRPVEEGHRERLLGGYGTVRRFLPLLLDTLHFQATDAGEHVLEAIRALRETDAKHSLTEPDVPMGIVTRAWRRLVLSEPGKVNRHRTRSVRLRRCGMLFTAATCSSPALTVGVIRDRCRCPSAPGRSRASRHELR